MSGAVLPRVRPERAVLWRAALVAVAALLVTTGAPAWARAPLSVAAALAVLQFLLPRLGGRGRVHALALSVGGGVVVLVLLGLLLDLTPWGLTSGTWGVAVGLVELVALAAVRRRRPVAAPRTRRRLPLSAIGWGAAVVAVLAAAVGVSVASFTATHVDPLALSMRASGGSWVVSVTAGATGGPYDVDLVTAGGRRILAHDVSVGPGRTAVVTVPRSTSGRALVQLVPAGGRTPVRELIIAGGSGS